MVVWINEIWLIYDYQGANERIALKIDKVYPDRHFVDAFVAQNSDWEAHYRSHTKLAEKNTTKSERCHLHYRSLPLLLLQCQLIDYSLYIHRLY